MNKPLFLIKVLAVLLAFVITFPAAAHHEAIPVEDLSADLLAEQKQLAAQIAQIESVRGNYAMDLYEPLMALGHLYYETGRYDQAADVFRRTQHLTHRAHGVYTDTQMTSIDKLIQALAGSGDYLRIETQQRFRFAVANRAFDPADHRLVVAKVKLADWYRVTRRFSEALALYEEVSAANLALDVRVRILRSQALTMYLADHCCAADKLHQAYDLMAQSDTIGPVERLDAYADYEAMAAIESRTTTPTAVGRAPRYLGFADSGDVLTMMSLRKFGRARSELYVDFGEADRDAPPVKTMGFPVAMCSNTFGQLVTRNIDDAELQVSMTVTESGYPRNIQVEGDLPAKLKRYVRQSLQLGRFQSATNTQGESVSSSLQFTQNFAVHQQSVTSRNQVPEWSNVLVAQTCQTRGVQKI